MCSECGKGYNVADINAPATATLPAIVMPPLLPPAKCAHKMTTRPDDTPEVVVPPGEYFMMGDNRDDSLDSRVSARDGGVGYVPEENLIGRVDRLAFSFDPARPWWDWLAGFRPSRTLSPIR